MMKESRQRQLLEGQSSMARKVFEGVPIQEAWSENDIVKAMRSSSMTVAVHTIRACLLDMVDAGLIRQPKSGHYQREPVQPFLRLPTDQPTNNIEPVMSTAKKPEPTPLDLLGTVATELVLMASEFAERMKALAARVEEVALQVEAQREADASTMAKVNQLKALLSDVVGQ